MSPAMVAIRTPATQDPSRNPRESQIPSLDQTRNPSVIMDQSNLGHDFFPPSPFPPISSTGKQSLTKPRMVKARKGVSSKSRPPASDPNPSPSPFRSDKIEERLSGWNPFVPDSGARVSDASANSDAGVFIFGGAGLSRNSSMNSNASFGSGAFVFGSGGGGERTGFDLRRNSSMGLEEGRRLNVGKSGNFGEEMEEEGGFVFGSSGEKSSLRMNRKGNEGVSVFRNSVFRNSVNESSEKTEKLNTKETNAGDGNSAAFVFGSSTNERNEAMERLNVKETIESGDSAAGVFVFGSSRKGSLGSGQQLKPLSEVKKGEENKEGVDVGNGFVSGGNTVNTDLEKLKIGREGENFVGATPFKYTFQAGKKDSSSSMGSCPPSEAETVHVEFRTTKQDASWVTKETGWQEQVDVSKGFVSGASGSVTGSFGGSAVNMVHDDMARPKTGCKVESFVGSTPIRFSFPAGEHAQSSSMGSVPPSQAAAPPPFHPPPMGPTIQPVRAQFTFGSKPGGSEAPPMEFQTPKHDASRLTKENLFPRPSQNIAFSAKRGEVRGMKLKKKKVKSRQPASYHQSFDKQFVHMEGGFQENPATEPNDGYSPMDCSPYQEDTVADQYSREASVASDDSSHFVYRYASTDTQRSISVDEREEVLTAGRLDINYGNDLNEGELDDNGSKDHVQISSVATSSFEDEQIFGYEKDTDKPKYENMSFDCDARTASMEAETCSLGSNFERESSVGETGFIFSSSVEEFSQSKSTFNSLSFGQGNPSQKRNYRRRSRTKPGQDSYLSNPNAKLIFASPPPNTFPPTNISLASVSSYEGMSFVSQNEDGNKAAKGEELGATQEPTTITDSRVAVQEACEKWRQRGNQAYTNGYLSKAEDYYTRGINSVSAKESISSCIRPLTLCYSNRAATRMALGRMREALGDCKMALTIDPNFLRAQVRAANCYLSLGAIGEALKTFKKCLQKEDISSNQKIATEASEGLQKAQQVSDLTGQSAELLLKRTWNDASKALQIISDALLISPLSESLLEMKAEALLMTRNYEEVIQLCEETLDLAERNCDVDPQLMDVVSSELLKSSPARLWRWQLISKSYFYLGKLEEALELLQKHDKELGNRSSESSTSLAVTIRELLRLKAAGNEAFQAARHSEAVECYTAALVCNAESRPFAAVCFCNRAAAYQALGQITEAIADCSLAIALDPSYRKAISRRATLHEMIRDYGQAANDLQRLVSLLENQSKEKDNLSGTSGRSIGYDSDLKRTRIRLATVEEEARKGRSLDMYIILGIEPSSSAADVKKAYRKAALRHHPDKAGQFLVRNENVDDGLWKEVADEVHNDADRLFKMIGESYTILSDPTKRLQYCAEEEMRTSMKKGYDGTTPSKTSADGYNSHYERNINRGQWRAQGSSYQRW